MKKNFLASIALFVSVACFAQLKTLTLEESVMQQNRNFRPDKFLGFQWIPKTDKYIFLGDSGRKLMSAGSSVATPAELVTLEAVNKATGANLRSFAGLVWINDKAFILSDGRRYFEYNTATAAGRVFWELPEGAENATFDSAKSVLAYTLENNLYILKNGQSTPVTLEKNIDIVSGQSIARNEFGISNGIFWSPKSSYLAFYQKDQSEVADYPLLDITTTPGKLENIKYPMIGQTSEKPRVGIYDLARKTTVFIAPKGNPDDYLTNLSWTPDEKFILIAELNRGQNDMRLNLYEAATGNFVRTIIQERASTWVEPEHAAYFPSEKSNNFIWISEKDGFDNLYYYSLEGKLIRQLTSNKFVAKEILGHSPAGNEIYFTATGPNPLNLLAYKVDLKGKQTLLTKEQGVHFVSMSDDRNWIFDEYSNHATPSRSMLIDKNGKSKLLLESPNKYEGFRLGTSEIKTIKAADGTTDLYTRLIKPSNFDPSKKYPVFIYVYGGPHAQLINNSFLDGANLWMYWMAEQGYLVFTVDNRGSANRGRDFEHVVHRNLGVAEIDDQMKGVDYLLSLPYVDAGRLAVHGWSYGGFMATSLMLRKPDVFKVGVAGGPVTDWQWYEAMYGERYMDTPSENAKGFTESSTLNYVKDLKGKLLLIHGTSDDVVVMQHNLALVKKFIEAGKQIDFFPYPMHRHNVAGKDRVHLIQKVLDYVLQHN
jgi:dipeptidyl-peptidase 4